MSPRCPMCNGEACLLGELGMLRWWRCRACGWEWSAKRRRRRAMLPAVGIAALSALLSLACGQAGQLTGPSVPVAQISSEIECIPQRLACFYAKTTVTVQGVRIEALVTSEDLPYPGYMNRWHYRFGPEADVLLLPLLDVRHVTPVCGGALVWPSGQGGMWQEAEGGWRLDMRPTDPKVAEQFASLAGANECRTQPWTVLLVGGRLEILIEELAP